MIRIQTSTPPLICVYLYDLVISSIKKNMSKNTY